MSGWAAVPSCIQSKKMHHLHLIPDPWASQQRVRVLCCYLLVLLISPSAWRGQES